MLDAGRKYDIEELARAIELAPSVFWREHYEKILDKVLRETGEVRSMREELIGAVRTGDRRVVKKMNMKLLEHRAKEDYIEAKEREYRQRHGIVN